MGDFSGREPCPYRILDDIGGAYAMGCVGGSIWHFVKGWRNAPKGSATSGAFEQVRVRAPVVGGNFAVWGGLFACFDCSLVAVRHKEDPATSEQSKHAKRPPQTAKLPPTTGALTLTCSKAPDVAEPFGALRQPLTKCQIDPPTQPIAYAPPMSSKIR